MNCSNLTDVLKLLCSEINRIIRIVFACLPAVRNFIRTAVVFPIFQRTFKLLSTSVVSHSILLCTGDLNPVSFLYSATLFIIILRTFCYPFVTYSFSKGVRR